MRSWETAKAMSHRLPGARPRSIQMSAPVRLCFTRFPCPAYKRPMICAVIVAAGKGTRMGPNIDKLFLPVAGRPVIAHTWERFDRFPDIAHIVLVVRDGLQTAFEEIATP